MIEIFAISALAGMLFVELIVISLCFAYLLDFFVRLSTNDRYEIISRAKKK